MFLQAPCCSLLCPEVVGCIGDTWHGVVLTQEPVKGRSFRYSEFATHLDMLEEAQIRSEFMVGAGLVNVLLLSIELERVGFMAEMPGSEDEEE